MLCRFHSCHEAALQALYCLKARAEYELLPGAMQVRYIDLHSSFSAFVVHFDNESC